MRVTLRHRGRHTKVVFAAAAASALLGQAVASAAPTTYTEPSAGAGNWDVIPWVPANGDATLAYPNRVGDIAQYTSNTANGAAVLNLSVALGQLRAADPGRLWAITVANASTFTFDNTGGATNDFGFSNAAIYSAGGAGDNATVSVAPAIVIANTDLDVGTVNGGFSIAGAITASTAQTLNFRNNSPAASAKAITVTGAIGATGSAITLNNIGTTATSVLLNGAIGPSVGAVTHASPGLLNLNVASTYTGATNVTGGGTLRTVVAGGLPTNSFLNLANGVLETPGGVTRALGGAAGNVQISGGTSGFSAFGAAITVNLGGAAAGVQFGSANFNPSVLVLNAATANNTLAFSNPLDLNGVDRTILTGANVATAGGVISSSSGTAGLTKTGGGTLALTATNTYAGITTVSGGTLRATDGVGLPAAGNLTLNAGVFETAGASFTRGLGTGGGQVQLTGGAAGFSAFGVAATVNVGGAAAPLQFGSAGFNPSSLVLNAATATGALTLANPLDFNGATRTIAVNNGPAAGTATLAAAITDSAASGTTGLTKTGTGTLVLAATSAYAGPTTVSGGVLRATDGTSLPAAGNLTLNGGSFETGAATFTRGLGTGGGQVQLPGGASGFSSAVPAGAVVNLGGAGATIQYATASTFVPATLVVNAASATGPLDFQNPLDLNGATRTLAGNGTGANVGTISGVIGNTSGTAAGITVNGTGVLVLTGANTYNGTTTLTAGTLSVGADANLGAAGPVTFAGGTLRVTGTTLNNFGTRTVTYGTAPSIDLADAANTFTLPSAPAFTTGALTKAGAGTLALGAATNVVTTLTVNGGVLDLGNTVLQVNNGGAQSIRATTGNGTINASGTGAIQLTVSDGDSGAASGFTLTINAPITGAFRFENFVAANGTGVTVLANPNSSFSGGIAINSSVVAVPAIGNAGQNGPLGTNGTINIANAGSTLRYIGTGEANDRVIALTGTTTGGIIEQAGTGLFRLNGNINSTGAGIKTLTLLGSTAGVGEVAGVINNQSATNTTALTKSGTGTWALSGANTYSGPTAVTAGTLLANNTSGSATGTGAVTVSGTGTLGGSGTIAGAVTVNLGGTINPGNSPGTLSIAGPLTFGSTGTGTAPTYTAELLPSTTPVAGTSNDLIALTGAGAAGALTLTNPDRLNLSILSNLPGPTTYTIATFASVTGTFDSVVVNGVIGTQNTTPGGANYALVTYNGTDIQVTVANLTAVPEPASAGLLGLAAAGLLARHRRRAGGR